MYISNFDSMCRNKNIFWLFGSILPIFWLAGNINMLQQELPRHIDEIKVLFVYVAVIQSGHVATLNSFVATNKGKTTWLHFFPSSLLLQLLAGRGIRDPKFEIRNRRWKKSTGGFFLIFFYVMYSTWLHLPPLRFHCVGGCWGRTQDCCDFGIGSKTL